MPTGPAPLYVALTFLVLIFGALLIEGNPRLRFKVQEGVTNITGWDPNQRAKQIADRKWAAADSWERCNLAKVWISEIASKIDRDSDGVIGDPRPNSAYSVLHMSTGKALHTLKEVRCGE
jgi:hypothetical protein